MTSSADPAALPQCAVAVDLVVLTVREGQLCVLTVRRGIPPFRGRFALPGGFVLPDEGLEAAAYRELAEEAGLARGAVTLEQLRTFGELQRDPRGRVVSVAYLALGAGLPDPLERAGLSAWAASLGIRDARAVGIVTAPATLFRAGEPLALMPFALLSR